MPGNRGWQHPGLQEHHNQKVEGRDYAPLFGTCKTTFTSCDKFWVPQYKLYADKQEQVLPMADRDGKRLSTVRGPVQPGRQPWGDLAAAAPQYLCSDCRDEAEQTCYSAVQEDERQQALSNWKKKGLNCRSSDCLAQDESQATMQGTELLPALEVLKSKMDKALSNPV